MTSHTDIEDQAAALLAKRDSGDWTADDQVRFSEWMEASTAHRVAVLRLEAVWEDALRLKAISAGLQHGTVPPPGEWQHSPFFSRRQVAPSEFGSPPSRVTDSRSIEQRVSAEPVPLSALEERGSVRTRTRGEVLRGRPRVRLFAVAASLLLAVGMGTYFAFAPSGDRYTTPIGGIASVPLRDGSNITLNTASQVHVELTPTERHVRLDKGEAFFEVAKDPNRPFIVQVDGKRVIAVGTKFSVRRNGNDIRVAVSDGKVRVEHTPSPLRVRAEGAGGEASQGNGSADVFVPAGSVASTDNDRVMVHEESLAAVEDNLSWRQGYLTFHDTSLADAIAEFNRYNTHRITIEDPKIAAIRISGTFRAINYQAFVRVLGDGFSIHAKSTDDSTTLTTD